MNALKENYDRVIPLYYDDPIIIDWWDFGEGRCKNKLLNKLLFSDMIKI